MIRVAILGATGYTACELMSYLLRHPEVEITALTTRQEDRPHVSEIHPSLRNRLDLVLENLNPTQVAERADCVFCCLPHAASAEVVAEYLKLGCRVIDFSADYRLNDVDSYQQWYGAAHPDPDRVGSTPYGLPELFRDQIADAQLVANPGCFPTSAILGLAPLLKHGLIEPQGIIVDAKTGTTGAGRTPKPAIHFPECNESVVAYSVGSHRHMPEIDQILHRALEMSVEVVFTPHLIPMDRGILSAMYARPTISVTPDQLRDAYEAEYENEPFIRLCSREPSTKQTYGTNFCDLSIRMVRGYVLAFSAIDNLVKGASGAAVQNFNVMFGFDETTALMP